MNKIFEKYMNKLVCTVYTRWYIRNIPIQTITLVVNQWYGINSGVVNIFKCTQSDENRHVCVYI